jgi:diphthamide synthase (EF-2-diphthine--ammonia ligase)
MPNLDSRVAATTALAMLSPLRHRDTEKALENIVPEMSSVGA